MTKTTPVKERPPQTLLTEWLVEIEVVAAR